MNTTEIPKEPTGDVRTLVYDSLGVPPYAGLDVVLESIARAAPGIPEQVRIGGVLMAISDEIHNYSANSQDAAAAARFERALDRVSYIPLETNQVRKINQELLDLCLGILQAPDCSVEEKAATWMMSLGFGLDQISDEKGDAIWRAHSEADGKGRSAIEAYLRISGLKLEDLATPSRSELGLKQAASDRRVLASNANKYGYKVGGAILAGTLGIGLLSSSPAAAQENAVQTVTVTPDLSPDPISDSTLKLEKTVSSLDGSALRTVPIVADLSHDNAQNNVKIDQLSPTDAKPKQVNIVADTSPTNDQPEAQKLPAVSVSGQATKPAQVEVSVDTQASTNEQPVKPLTGISNTGADGQTSADNKPSVAVPVTPTVDNTPPSETDQTPLTAKITVPNSDVNVAPNETPQQAIDRLVKSRDLNATSYAIRKLYGVNSVDSKPTNTKLATAVDTLTGTLEQQILDAKHDDASTDKALLALAYLDAASKDPTVLDNSDVAAFLSGLSDLGEAYHNRIYAPYLDDADTKLTSDDFGAFDGIDDKYQSMLENAYAYSNFAAVPETDQAKQIQTIKDAEAAAAQKAAEAAAAQKAAADAAAAQNATQGSAEAAPTVSPEAQALQEMVDRSADDIQKRTNTAYKYFIDHGFTPEQASGIVGNLLRESGGTMDPGTKQGNGGPGRGIAQWGSWLTDGAGKYVRDQSGNLIVAGRFGNLVNFAKSQGKNWDDLGVQLDYIMYEFNGGENKALGKVQAAQTVHDAAYAFMYWYERPNTNKSVSAAAHEADVRTSRATPVFDAYHQNVDRVNQERAAAAQKAAADATAKQAAAQEAARQAAAAAAERQAGMTSGKSIFFGLYAEHHGESGTLNNNELASTQVASPYGKDITIRLNPEAMKQFEKMAAAYQAQFGERIMISDNYRTYAEQVSVKDAKGDIAAPPGQSNHGWGMALDISNLGGFGATKYEWLRQNGPQYGWVNPTWANDGKGKEEPWHFEYLGTDAGTAGYQGLIVPEAEKATGIPAFNG